ncbi:hypothetical protein LJC49_07040 [Ruminococcaceae bacterium OttesenSCG-928-I18]|nr:hypothetical protein [Ruminococcaceae bacterium OttesenSCG-928-I18]
MDNGKVRFYKKGFELRALACMALLMMFFCLGTTVVRASDVEPIPTDEGLYLGEFTVPAHGTAWSSSFGNTQKMFAMRYIFKLNKVAGITATCYEVEESGRVFPSFEFINSFTDDYYCNTFQRSYGKYVFRFENHSDSKVKIRMWTSETVI